MRIAHLGLIGLALGAAACDSSCPPTGPARFDVTDAIIGEDTFGVVRVTNTCGSSLPLGDVSVSGDATFALDEGADSLPAEAEAPISVTFTTDDYDLHVAELTLTSEEGDVTVVLTGQANPDQDGDGVDAYEAGGEDCDDTDPDVVGPREEEVNGRDDDCDGLVDEDQFKAGDVVITELMLTPDAATGRDGQWIELRNNGRLRVDLRGWTLSGPSGTYTIGEGLQLSDGEIGVVGFSADTAVNGGVDVGAVLTGPDAPLPTQGWYLTLGVDGRVISVLSDKRWPEEAGRSIALDPDVRDPAEATRAESWCTSTTELASGDFGTPGARNDLCPQFDHDGDGLSVLEGDCDDTDREISPIAIDVWDGLDNDCNGEVDLVLVQGAVDGAIQGANGDRLGDDIAVDDWDGDAAHEVLALSRGFGAYRLLVIPEGSLIDPGVQALEDVATGAVEEPGGGGAQSAITGVAPPYDMDGDGDEDLIVLGRPANFYRDGTSFDYLWVHEGLPDSVDEPLLAGDALITVRDPLDGNGSEGVATLFDVDMDGDGVNDTVFGHGSYKGTIEGFDRVNKGRVWILELEGTSGSVVPQDVMTASWIGETDYTGAGDALAGGDVDGDGYGDLIVMDMDPAGDMEGARRVQGIPGGVELPMDGTLEGSAAWTITGLANRTGFQTSSIEAPMWADVDGDGSEDLVVPDPFANQVLIWHAPESFTGTVEASSADFVIEGSGGMGSDLALGDTLGDGTIQLLVGAPTNSTSGGGRAYLFDGSLLSGTGSIDTSVATASFGSSTSGTFGDHIVLFDVTGDGKDDVLVGDDSSYSQAGGLFTFQAP